MITVRVWHVLYRHCDHCDERTAHVGIEGYTCLQCIADGGTCCSLRQFDRHVPNPIKPRRR